MKRLFKSAPRELCILTILLCVPFSQYLFAETAAPDVRLVIDVSGSMKRNDPNNLRQPAVELLVQLLPDNSKAGVWTFGKWVNMLVPHRSVSEEWRKNALGEAGKINSVGLFTNIGGALEKAAFDSPGDGDNFRKSIILLTDGMVDIDKDPGKNEEEWRRIVDEVLPLVKKAGFKIHTIALSKNADRNLLNKLSVGTDGIAELAQSADDLMRIFLKAFDVAAPSEQVPLADNSFVIDSSVEEFTALIFRKDLNQDTVLIGPDEEQYGENSKSEDLKWYKAKTYDLITVTRPLEGEWVVKADMDPESRVTVVSNLNLRVRPLPNNVFKGQEHFLSMLLQEDGRTIVRSEFLNILDINARMQAGPDESSLEKYWQKILSEGAPPADGVYGAKLPTFEKDGVYSLELTVDGKTFTREFKHQFTVRQSFAANVKSVFREGKDRYLLTVQSFESDLDFKKTKVIARISGPGKTKKMRVLSPTNEDTWEVELEPEMEGAYKATIVINGVRTNEASFETQLDDVTFNYSLAKGFVTASDPYFKEKAELAELALEEKKKMVSPAPSPVPEGDEEAPVDDQTEEPQVEAATALPSWLLYAIVGFSNILLFLLAYFVYRKMFSGQNSEEDLLNKFSDDAIESEDAPAEQAEEPEEAAVDVDEAMQAPAEDIDSLEEEEPPMEDLDPSMDDDPELMSAKPMDEEMDEEMAEVMQMDAGEGENSGEDESEESDESDYVDVDEALDDLDAMAMNGGDENEATDIESEEDEMVSEMLKAQGLDLAEEELDEAISNLIDDLDDDEDGDKP